MNIFTALSTDMAIFPLVLQSGRQFYSNLQRINVARSYNYNFVRSFAKDMGLPRVFFDMSADGAPVGRIVIEVSHQPVYLT